MGSITQFPLRQTRFEYNTAAHNTYARGKGAGLKGQTRDGGIFGITLATLTFAGWCQHLYTCFFYANWGFLITGAVISPIGIFNGWGIWLGWW